MIAATAEWTVGLDLGQAQDPSALAVLKRRPLVDEAGVRVRDERGIVRHRLDVVHLQRWPLGVSYPQIVAEVTTLCGRPELASGRFRPRLAIDATGVGRAVVDLILAARPAAIPVPVTITAGEGHRADLWAPGVRGYWTAKKELVSRIQTGLHAETLKIVPSLPLADTLKRELMDFKVKITTSSNEQFGAWRDGQHDDLVLACAVAAWLAELPLPELRFF